MKPEIVYNELVPDRSDYLEYAEDVAELTMPWLKPKGEDIEQSPWTSQGTSSVRNLSSATTKLMFPTGVEWARVHLPQHAGNTLNEKAADPNEKVTPEQIEALKDALSERTQQVHKSLKKKNVRSRLAMALTRNLVEGTTVAHNTVRGMRVFPLRSLVVRRDEFGEVEVIVLKQEREPLPEEMQSKGSRKSGIQCSYTLVDFTTGEVWQQEPPAKAGGEPVVTMTEEPPARYMCIVGELPDVDNYPPGYFYNFIRLIAAINHAEASLADAMSLASWNPLGIREGSALADDTDQITTRKTGEPVIMQEGDAFPAVQNQQKLGEWAFIGGILEHDKAELAAISAKGIKDRGMSPDTSATAVIQMIDELNSQTQDLLSALEETLQRPLFKSEMSLLEEATPMFDKETTELLGPLLEVSVITGINALEKQRSFMTFVTTAIPFAQEIDPSVGADGIKILDRMAETMLMDVEGLYFRIEQPASGTVTPGGSGQPQQNKMTRGGPQGPQTQPAAPQNAR